MIEARFAGVSHFPGTHIFYLPPQDPRPFLRLHEAIIASSIRFRSSPFPYTPHCTIRLTGRVSPEDEAALLALAPPQEALTLDTLSVYQVRPAEVACELLNRTRLLGVA